MERGSEVGCAKGQNGTQECLIFKNGNFADVLFIKNCALSMRTR